jgi:hypothetical protein
MRPHSAHAHRPRNSGETLRPYEARKHTPERRLGKPCGPTRHGSTLKRFAGRGGRGSPGAGLWALANESAPGLPRPGPLPISFLVCFRNPNRRRASPGPSLRGVLPETQPGRRASPSNTL